MAARKKASELPFSENIARWNRIQRAGQRFAEVIMRETGTPIERNAAIVHVRDAILCAQADPGPQPKTARKESPLDGLLAEFEKAQDELRARVRAETGAIGGVSCTPVCAPDARGEA